MPKALVTVASAWAVKTLPDGRALLARAEATLDRPDECLGLGQHLRDVKVSVMMVSITQAGLTSRDKLPTSTRRFALVD
jgi:hypothetical protein